MKRAELLDVKAESGKHQDLAPSAAESQSKLRTTHGGYGFDALADKWQLTARLAIYTKATLSRLSPRLRIAARETLATYAETKAATSVKAIWGTFAGFLEVVGSGNRVTSIDSRLLINYRDFLNRTYGHEGELSGRIRPFLRKWHNLGFVGISSDLIAMIDGWRLSQWPVGAAVNRNDPECGPFMGDELAALELGWTACYDQGTLDLSDYVHNLLLSRTGRRPAQLLGIKLKDLEAKGSSSTTFGDTGVQAIRLRLWIPRVKQRGSKWREQLRAVQVTPAIWNALQLLRADVVNHFNKLLQEGGICLPQGDLQRIQEELPLFPAWSLLVKAVAEVAIASGNDDKKPQGRRLQEWAETDAWHGAASSTFKALKRSSEANQSLDMGATALHVEATRFRYTKATTLKRDGHTDETVAWVMDHSTTASVKIYEKNLPDRAKALSKSMAMRLAPLSKLFLGKVVDSEADAKGGDDPAKTRLLFHGEGAATCGISKQCGMKRIPRCCYLCSQFQPWLDGPHEQVLEELLMEREQRRKHLDDPVMVGVDDLTIVATVQAIQSCEARRQELRAAAKNND